MAEGAGNPCRAHSQGAGPFLRWGWGGGGEQEAPKVTCVLRLEAASVLHGMAKGLCRWD